MLERTRGNELLSGKANGDGSNAVKLRNSSSA